VLGRELSRGEGFLGWGQSDLRSVSELFQMLAVGILGNEATNIKKVLKLQFLKGH
jgi:hypothetical protein